MSESGAVGSISRQQLELFSISRLFSCIVDADDDSIYLDSTVTPGAHMDTPDLLRSVYFLPGAILGCADACRARGR